MLEGMFKFRNDHSIVWIDLTSVNAFVGGKPYQNSDNLRYYSILFRNGKLTDILSTEQEIDEVIKQYRVDGK